ncbi:hypothetical protein [uncultured Gimesia sp.]|uniref:hypothetical protein n=1 Tax=uncultured Gimesia sp. TaxID=1678688 RepID=UPI00261E67E8|nr:hypothetical protein [uncultured Gimesia sp.]
MKSTLMLVIFILAVGLPVAWLLSEFQPRRWLRILLGLAALLMTVYLSHAFSIFDRLNYNTMYSEASAKLIDTTIVEIEAGRSNEFLSELRILRSKFRPSFKSVDYNELVNQFAIEVKEKHPADE